MTKLHLAIAIFEVMALISLLTFTVRMLVEAWNKYWDLHDH